MNYPRNKETGSNAKTQLLPDHFAPRLLGVETYRARLYQEKGGRTMKTQSADTHPSAEAVQIQLLRKAGSAKRAWLMRSLSQTMLRLSRRTIRQANPDLNEQELDLLFVKHCYGDELAQRLRIYLNREKEHGTP
jgi:hypothetical protein